MQRFSLEDALLMSTQPVAPDSIHWRSTLLFLTFSLNPFVFAIGKSIHLSGLVPFLLILPAIMLVFFYMNKLIIENFNNFSTNLQDLYNNYFHRLDRALNLTLLLYGLCYISIATTFLMMNIISFCRDFGYDEISPRYIFIALLAIGVITVLISCSNRIDNYFYLALISVFFWVCGLIGAIIMVFFNWDKTRILLTCKSFYFSSDFYHVVYILVVPMNICHAFTLIYRDFKEKGIENPREICLKSLKTSTFITVIAYIVLGICLGFTEELSIYKKDAVNHFNLNVLAMIIYRLFKFLWFSLQVALIMPTIKLALIGLIKVPDSEINKKLSIALSIVFSLISICVATTTYLFHRRLKDSKIGGKIEECTDSDDFSDIEFSEFYLDLNIKYYFIHYLFLATSLLSAFVGLLFPWGVMIRAFKYDLNKIVITGFVVLSLIACICLEFVFPQKKPII